MVPRYVNGRGGRWLLCLSAALALAWRRLLAAPRAWLCGLGWLLGRLLARDVYHMCARARARAAAHMHPFATATARHPKVSESQNGAPPTSTFASFDRLHKRFGKVTTLRSLVGLCQTVWP
eukprot:SAG25_NODE_564_length_6902_cov_5.254741_1_plen_120_part_10